MIVSCDKSRYRVTPDYISPVLVSFSQQREVSRQSDTVTPPDLLGPREQSVSVPHKQETAPGPSLPQSDVYIKLLLQTVSPVTCLGPQ